MSRTILCPSSDLSSKIAIYSVPFFSTSSDLMERSYGSNPTVIENSKGVSKENNCFERFLCILGLLAQYLFVLGKANIVT